MRGRFSVALAITFVLVGLRAPPGAACPSLPDGLLARAWPINLYGGIPGNGALVFRLSCWHDCTPCQAGEQAIRVNLRDASGRQIPGRKPEQVFLSGKPVEHLVIWRPLELLEVGAHYTLETSVVGQSDLAMSD